MDHPWTYTLVFYLTILPLMDSFSFNFFKESFVVFMAFDVNLSYQDATTICANYDDASLASLEQVNSSLQSGVEFCKWGWVKEQMIAMPRKNPDANCASSKVGFVIRDSMNSSFAYCIKGSGKSSMLYDSWLGHLDSSFENASIMCALSGDVIATRQQIESTSDQRIKFNRSSWFNWGIGFINPNGTFQVLASQATERRASAFCVRPKPDKGCTYTMFSSMFGSACFSSLFTGVMVKRKKVMAFLKSKIEKIKGVPNVAEPTPKSAFLKSKLQKVIGVPNADEPTPKTTFLKSMLQKVKGAPNAAELAPQSTIGSYQAINDPKEAENVFTSAKSTLNKSATEEKRQIIYLNKKVFKSHGYENEVLSDVADE